MSKSKRIKRTKKDLKQELAEQLQLLSSSCGLFDSGFEAAGKHIALSLRVLIHHRGQSRSLLEQLNLRACRFLDSAGLLTPNNLMPECKLVLLRGSTSSGMYVPLIAAGGGPFAGRLISFKTWWNIPILKDHKGRTFSRKQIVLNVSDTDGGAHVDPELEEKYMELSRENSLGWIFKDGSMEKAFDGRPELACVRQIAHELMCTLEQSAPEFSEYAKPVAPELDEDSCFESTFVTLQVLD